MKNVLVVMMTVLALMVSGLAVSQTTEGKWQDYKLENGTFVVTNVTEIVTRTETEAQRISGVPDGLSIDDVRQVLEGKDELIKDQKVEKKMEWGIPLQFISITSGKKINYANGQWKEELVNDAEERSNWKKTFLVLGLPLISFVGLGLSKRFRIKPRNLFYFFGSIMIWSPIATLVLYVSSDLGPLVALVIIASSMLVIVWSDTPDRPYLDFLLPIANGVIGTVLCVCMLVFHSMQLAFEYLGFVVAIMVIAWVIIEILKRLFFKKEKRLVRDNAVEE